MRFWSPRRAAAYRIVEDALDYYGAKRVRLIANHIASAESDEEAFGASAFEKFYVDDETYLLLSRLSKLSDSNESMFKNVKSELGKFADDPGHRKLAAG